MLRALLSSCMNIRVSVRDAVTADAINYDVAGARAERGRATIWGASRLTIFSTAMSWQFSLGIASRSATYPTASQARRDNSISC